MIAAGPRRTFAEIVYDGLAVCAQAPPSELLRRARPLVRGLRARENRNQRHAVLRALLEVHNARQDRCSPP